MIESYDFGRIVIDGVTYTADVIVLGNRVKGRWWRKEGHVLHVSDINETVEAFAPEVIIVGTGYRRLPNTYKPKGSSCM